VPDQQSNFFDAFDDAEWPDPTAFPLNERGPCVGDFVRDDIAASDQYLVVTGFTSLNYLIEFFADLDDDVRPPVDFILGNEPDRYDRPQTHPKVRLSEEIKSYWLERGISIRLSSAVIKVIELIKAGELSFRILRRLHAKLFVGDNHAILGSSNFSRAGLQFQREANVRFERGTQRYASTRRIAENYLKESQSFNREIIALLEELLQWVSWEESLSRAAAELLEGQWIDRYPTVYRPALADDQLWPSQKQAIAQALWVLDNHGSVLIADPTGSGKTRLAVHLLYSLLSRVWARGRGHRDTALIVAPPQVQDIWEEEIEATRFRHLETVSRGMLSSSDEGHRDRVVDKIRRRNILFVDEAHSYLNADSLRSQALENSMADHVVLLTATPINRGAGDILRMIELLGVDNLSDAEYRQYRRFSNRNGQLRSSDYDRLRRYIEPFIVRRTRSQLNRMIENDPDAYRNSAGDRCKYPEHICETYTLGETADDQAMAVEIRRLAEQLKGLLYLRHLHVPEYLKNGRARQQKLLDGRLRAASALSRYNVMSKLRSSRAALVEHVYGTGYAVDRFDLPDLGKDTGDVIDTLADFETWDVTTNLDVALPDWLTDPTLMREARDAEIDLYAKMADLALSISDARQESRADKIANLLDQHELLIAFDSRIISLHMLEKTLRDRSLDFEHVVVTGVEEAAKKRVNQIFRPGGSGGQMAALCSDTMSEGLNLQRASTVVFLDMPTVIRLAEQRVGRIDRMDSPHESIEVYWPKDSPAFTSATDRKFVERYFEVDKILGANMPLPDELLDGDEAPVTAEWMIEQYERRKKASVNWDGIQDAFEPIRRLVYGEDALVDPAVYEEMKDVEASVTSRVSLVGADEPWSFFALRGSKKRAPRWVYLEEGSPVVTDVPEICKRLRHRLAGAENLRADASDAHVRRLQEKFIDRVHRAERAMLPNKRRHALDQMGEVLNFYENWAEEATGRAKVCRRLLEHLEASGKGGWRVDLYKMARAWMECIEPRLRKKKEDQRRRQPVRLKDLTEDLKHNELSTEQLCQVADHTELIRPFDQRVAAWILGVPQRPEEASE
jgi:superfamily II DNA or RNA helicase